ncbi:chemotaxis protein CheD [Priestia aryabhattai]
MRDDKQVIKVGIAEMNVTHAPAVLRTAGLGSCVGVVVYDSIHSVAGLAHVMLPDSSGAKCPFNRAKYADTAIFDLINMLIKQGAHRRLLKAKIAGGAQMFQFEPRNDVMRIGLRNVQAVERELHRNNVEIAAKATGGHNGRTIEFDPQTAILKVRTINEGIKTI